MRALISQTLKYSAYGMAVLSVFAFSLTLKAQETPELEDPSLARFVTDFYAVKYRVSTDEASRRIAIQDRAAGIEDDLDRLLGDQYAGVWYDHSDRGRLKVGITPRAVAQVDSVRAILKSFGVSADSDLVSVRYTEGELQQIQARVRSDISDLVNTGKARTGYNTKVNLAVVTAISKLSFDEEARIQKLGSVPGVTVRRIDQATLLGEFNSCLVRTCDPPFRGGREIKDTSLGIACTAAFIARHRVTHETLSLTAGHCLFAGGLSDLWNSRNEVPLWNTVGGTYGYVFAGSIGKDAGVVDVDPGGYWGNPSPIPAVVVKSSDDTTYNPAYSIRHTSASSMGQLLCRTGRTTGTHCGEVSDLGDDFTAAINNTNYTIQNVGEMDMCDGQGGDSGSPVYKTHRAYGILIGTAKGTFTCYEAYQGVRGAESALNVDVLLAP